MTSPAHAAPTALKTNQPSAPGSVLVTGASGGIGCGISCAFARLGYRVGVHYHRRREEAAVTLEQVCAQGGRGALYEADILEAEAVDRMVATFCHESPPPYVFVCNAGVAASALIVRQPEQEWESVIQTNMTGTFHCLRAMGAALTGRGGGSIVVIGSHAGFHGATGQAAYAASKAGLVGLVKTAAKEWGSANVRINLLLPGWQRTGLAQDAIPKTWADHALHRPPALDDVARTVVHLAGLQGTSGQIWNCDSRDLSGTGA